MSRQRLHAYVHGRVQGVGFRWHVMQSIRLHMPEITGWIRNRQDGRVELLVEGNDDDLDRLLQVLNSGPGMAQVSRVDTEFSAAEGNLKGFDVNFDA